MDFNFGEIVEPVSRAFYDDYEDASLNLPFKRFAFNCALTLLRSHRQIFLYFRPSWKYRSEDGKPLPDGSIKSFVIIEGTNALNVVYPSILKNHIPVAILDGHKAEIFQFGCTTVCIVEEKDLNYFATITELLEPWIQSAETCSIVSLQSSSEYKADDLPETCTIRGINSKLSDIAPLEAPNFITGVAAGVGTSRKMSNLPFSCYVIYIDLYDVFAIRAILGVLKRLDLSVDDSVIVKPLHHKSDLYM